MPLPITRLDDMKTFAILEKLLKHTGLTYKEMCYIEKLGDRLLKVDFNDVTPGNVSILTDVTGKYALIMSLKYRWW